MAVRKRLVDLTITELKAVLKKKGLSDVGDRNELLMRLRQAMGENRTKATHSSVTTDASGTQDEKTASSNADRNTSGMMEKEEEVDLEVLLEEIEGRGRGIVNDGRKEGVSSTRGGGAGGGGSDESRREGKESESGEKLIGKETPRPIATLWISGLPSTAKATDLKQLFSQHGQVNGAKVVASSKSESKRFGIVTMSTAEEAQACIENVNNTEFLDNLITVEFDPKQRVVGESSQPITETDSKQVDLASSASLWISGLAMTTKAADLKEICMKHGEVVHAKVVASAKNPDSKCYYGIVTMSTKEEADCCIEKLNQTEVNGQIITLEKRKQDSASKAKSSSRPESTSSSSYRTPFERGRFSGSRGFGFRGRSFPPRPFMGRGRGDSGYRGRGRDNFMYMDQLREDYERQRFHEQRMREGGDRRDYMPDFPRGGRGRFSGRSRPPFERPWNDRRGGFRRGGMNDEPYWGQAAKRPRMDDENTGDARQFGESGNRFPAERAGSGGGGGGNWNSSNQGDKEQAPCEPFNAPSQDKGFGSTSKSNWPASDANTNKKGNSGSGGYNQWQSGGSDSTTNRSGGAYQSGSVMYSDYNATQSYSSGMDTSAGGSYQGAGGSSYAAATTGSGTYGTAGSNLYGNTGGSSYSGKESSSYAGAVTSVYSSAGSGSYGGGAGSTSYAAAGSGSYPTGGSSSYPATGSSSYPAGGSSYGGATGSSSYGGATGGSYGGATGGSYGASASSSYPQSGADAYGTMNSSYEGTDTSSYSAPGSSSYGTAYAAPVSTTYSAASVSYQGTDSYAAQQGGTSMYASDASYAGHAGSSTGMANSQAQYDSYKPQGSSQSYSWY